MTVKFDPHQSTLTLSVGDLCSDPVNSGSLNLVPLRDLRGELGREVHQEYQSAQSRAFPGYQTEVSLGYELEVDGCRATIQGRLDGVYRDRGGWVVEEVKSLRIYLEGEALQEIGARLDSVSERRRRWETVRSEAIGRREEHLESLEDIESARQVLRSEAVGDLLRDREMALEKTIRLSDCAALPSGAAQPQRGAVVACRL